MLSKTAFQDHCTSVNISNHILSFHLQIISLLKPPVQWATDVRSLSNNWASCSGYSL